MIYYIGLIFVIVLLYFLTHIRKKDNDLIFMILSFIVVFSFSALRSEKIGVDLPNYKLFFECLYNKNIHEVMMFGRYEPAFKIYNFIIYNLTNGNFRVFLVITSFLSCYGVFKFINKYSSNKLISIIAYICLGYFISSFSGLRQGIALSIICLGYKHIADRNFKKFMFYVIMATLFHFSALIFIISYFMYNLKFDGKRLFWLILLIPIIFVFRYRLVSLFASLYYTAYSSSVNNGGGFYILLLYVFIFSIITFYKKKFSTLKYGNMLYNYLYLGILIQILATVEGNAHRASVYYLISLVCTIPYMTELFNKKNRLIISILLFVLLIIYFMYVNPDITYEFFL